MATDGESATDQANGLEPIGLHAYWLREPAIDSLRSLVGVVDIVFDEIERVVQHRVPKQAAKLGLWDQEQRLLKWGVWSEKDHDQWHAALHVRRDILSHGKKGGTREEIDRICLGLIRLERKTHLGRPVH